MASDTEIIEHKETLTASGGRNHALCRALGGLLSALVESGCTLTAFEYSGNEDFGKIEFTVEGTNQQVEKFDASTDEWADA